MEPAAYEIKWQGIAIEVRYTPDWLGMLAGGSRYGTAHLEIEAVMPAKTPLPMTETGYKSHFCQPEEIEREGGPAAFAVAWLEAAAQLPQWKAAQRKARQLTLF
jgi:hypothetical protein